MTGPLTTGRLESGGLDPDELAALEEQRDFLLGSLRDLDREHDAGDLDEHDYATLRDDYTGRAAETIRAIDEHRAAFAARRRSSPGRRLAAVGGVAAFAVLAGLLVATSVGARRAGDSASGGITTKQSPSQRAQACIPKISRTSPTDSLACFKEVLTDDPENPVAHTWVAWQLGLVAELTPPELRAEVDRSAEDHIERAIASDPAYSYARAFRAVLAYRRGDFADAKRYLADFEAHDPSADAQQVIEGQQLAERIDEALAQSTASPTSSTVTATTSTPTPTSTTPSTSTPGG